MSAIRQFLRRIRTTGAKRPGTVTTVTMGRERRFHAWDCGDDTFIFEDGIAAHLKERPSVLIVEKDELGRKAHGRVMTMTTGNHAVAAFPLLDGRFWKLAHLPSDRRSEVLMRHVLCANVVGDAIETSQRDIPTRRLFEADDWLVGTLGFSLSNVVMGDRNESTLEQFRMRGQEWRMKPLAWTEAEMKVALAASKKRIASSLSYYHSVRGVHFLTFPEFARLCAGAREDPESFIRGLKELVSVYEGNRVSFARMVKYRGHHEIEFFGLRRGVALKQIVPEIERFMEDVVFGRVGALGILGKAREFVLLYESLLTRPELADESSKVFTETLYMHITGEIYSVIGDGATPAFDDRRTALPGATFVDGRPQMHPGADDRSEVLLSNLRSLMSKDEIVEYANVYELRNDDEAAPIGKGSTREIVYKTNRRPIEQSLVEKRLSSGRSGYGSYMLARIGALKSLGIALSENYRLLRRRLSKGRGSADFYIRDRCEGEPMDSIPANYFCSTEDSSVEEKDVVLALAGLMGDAAAQNLVMKKYDPKTETPLFGIGKEIYEFEYDIARRRVMPKRVSTCSMRGSFGWPSLEYDDANLNAIAGFYLTYYAHALKDFQRRHTVTMADAAEHFMNGFEFRIRALAWQLSVMRDRFESFSPDLPAAFSFDRKWKFVLWSLARHERRLSVLREIFFRKVALIEEKAQREE